MRWYQLQYFAVVPPPSPAGGEHVRSSLMREYGTNARPTQSHSKVKYRDSKSTHIPEGFHNEQWGQGWNCDGDAGQSCGMGLWGQYAVRGSP